MSSTDLFVSPSSRLKSNLAPGTRITVRSEDWVVRDCFIEPEIGHARVVHCEGISGFIQGISATFVDAFDHIEVIDPSDIEFVVDNSPKFIDSKLFIDIWAQKVIPSDNSLAIGHLAVVDSLPYQRIPAALALDLSRNIRPRILIADAVGLGKTIEVGILLSELIKRGRAKRILVVVLKSMLTQFQKELWSRFAIPLEATDRDKLESISRNIPRSMNPFDQVNKMIISMDTLKTKTCSHWLGFSRWDVVIIDECHNVARRGKGSQRSRLAQNLAKISDAMILTSATPHDGTASSYASLLELLNPLLVVDPEKITIKDMEPVTIQRYAKDALGAEHKKRREHKHFVSLDAGTLEILKFLSGKTFETIGNIAVKKKDALFRTTLSKALMSSPEAFAASVSERLKKIKKNSNGKEKSSEDLKFLENAFTSASKITVKKTAKYLRLVEMLNKEIPPRCRVVIFTESRKTLTCLSAALSEDLDLKLNEDSNVFDGNAKIVAFHGGQPEATQQEILDDFQTEKSKIRLLIATDVASEGLNLHFYCWHLIHYDIPWSLITISQRNGRIDRYGQKHHPEIHYLIGDTLDPSALKLSERRVVDILIDKAKNAEIALGNVGISLGVYDQEKEVEKVSLAVAFDDPLESLFSNEIPEISQTIAPNIQAKLLNQWRPFEVNNLNFAIAAAKFLKIPCEPEGEKRLTLKLDGHESVLRALRSSLAPLANELNFKKNSAIALTSSLDDMNNSIAEARKKSGCWPNFSFGWEIHPAIDVLSKLVESRFKKNEARVLRFKSSKAKGFLGFLVYRALYDHAGHPIFCTMQMAIPEGKAWRLVEPELGFQEFGFFPNQVNIGVELEKSENKRLKELAKSLSREFANRCQIDAASAQGLRDTAVFDEEQRASLWYAARKRYLENKYDHAMQSRRCHSELNTLNELKARHQEFIGRYSRIEASNLFFRINAVFWGG